MSERLILYFYGEDSIRWRGQKQQKRQNVILRVSIICFNYAAQGRELISRNVGNSHCGYCTKPIVFPPLQFQPRRPHTASLLFVTCVPQSSPSRKVPTNTAVARPGKSGPPSQWIHLCVQRISVKKGRRLEPSPPLSDKLKSASVVVFAATPKDHDRFFWSPLHPKVSPTRSRIEKKK